MRTTLVINDELLARAKKEAADRKSNVSEIVNEALRMAFMQEGERNVKHSFQVLTYRPRGAVDVDTQPSEFSDSVAAEDLSEFKK